MSLGPLLVLPKLRCLPKNGHRSARATTEVDRPPGARPRGRQPVFPRVHQQKAAALPRRRASWFWGAGQRERRRAGQQQRQQVGVFRRLLPGSGA